MRRHFPLVVLIILLAVAGGVMWSSRADERTFFLGGIQVNEPEHETWVRTLDEVGMNTVAVTVYARQGDWDSANLWFDDEAPWVINEIRVAKAHGLKVVLVLRVALDHAFERNKFFWHGMIMPRTAAQLGEWFDRYGIFVSRWAAIAEQEGIDILAVGSEMNALTNTVEVDQLPVLEEYWSNEEKVRWERDKILAHSQEIEERHLRVRGQENYESLELFLSDEAAAHRQWARQIGWLADDDPVARINQRRRHLETYWRRLIRQVRESYSGQLTYAANFDQYEFVGFWDELDLLAINAYFPLRASYEPDLSRDELADRLETGWTEVLRRLDEFRKGQGIPRHRVLLSELGYVERANSTIEPWASNGFSVLPSSDGPQLVVWEDQPPDKTERALAIGALFNANKALGGELLGGILYWKLSTNPDHREVEPFVLVIGGKGPEDPMLGELRRFAVRP
ncbi:MAG: hypothetical protein EP299_01410 [Acidobacteria bacterium]|nr:MAG: hypothetical protein EP299_01410 [Acidobacteriota bacterium]